MHNLKQELLGLLTIDFNDETGIIIVIIHKNVVSYCDNLQMPA